MGNSESASAMLAAARDLLEALGDGGRTGAARLPFDDAAERRDWHYVPRARRGSSLGAMDVPQARAAHALLSSGLSLAGYAAATAIVALEDVLDRIEGRNRGRHHRDYSVTVFDEPDATAPWGWRFEGHHVSVNVTVVDGRVRVAPLFLGANPAEVLGPSGVPVTRPLAAEEDVALALFAALAPAQRDRALLSDVAPDDILTGAAPLLGGDDLPQPVDAGLPLGALAGDAADLAHRLVRLHLERLPPDVAGDWWRRIEPTLGDVRWAVAGRIGHRLPHYYRLVGPSLLVEYDNTQNDANHVHTVLRDPDGDFGEDLLRAHRQRHH